MCVTEIIQDITCKVQLKLLCCGPQLLTIGLFSPFVFFFACTIDTSIIVLWGLFLFPSTT